MRTVSGFGPTEKYAKGRSQQEISSLLAESLKGSEIRSHSHPEGGLGGSGLVTKKRVESFGERINILDPAPPAPILFLSPQKMGSVLSGEDKPKRI